MPAPTLRRCDVRRHSGHFPEFPPGRSSSGFLGRFLASYPVAGRGIGWLAWRFETVVVRVNFRGVGGEFVACDGCWGVGCADGCFSEAPAVGCAHWRSGSMRELRGANRGFVLAERHGRSESVELRRLRGARSMCASAGILHSDAQGRAGQAVARVCFRLPGLSLQEDAAILHGGVYGVAQPVGLRGLWRWTGGGRFGSTAESLVKCEWPTDPCDDVAIRWIDTRCPRSDCQGEAFVGFLERGEPQARKRTFKLCLAHAGRMDREAEIHRQFMHEASWMGSFNPLP